MREIDRGATISSMVTLKFPVGSSPSERTANSAIRARYSTWRPITHLQELDHRDGTFVITGEIGDEKPKPPEGLPKRQQILIERHNPRAFRTPSTIGEQLLPLGLGSE